MPTAEEEREIAERTRRAVEKAAAKPRVSYGGRGGAGNWNGVTDDIEDERKAIVDERVEKDVVLGLALPKKAYAGTAREEV